MLAVPAGQLVSLVSAISLLGGGMWYEDRTAVVAAIIMGVAKICDSQGSLTRQTKIVPNIVIWYHTYEVQKFNREVQ